MQSINQLSAVLKQRREQLGINQKDMLFKIGMSQQQYQRIEAGQDLRVSTLLRVLEGFGLQLLIAEKEKIGLLAQLSKLDSTTLQQLLVEHTQAAEPELADFLAELGDET